MAFRWQFQTKAEPLEPSLYVQPAFRMGWQPQAPLVPVPPPRQQTLFWVGITEPSLCAAAGNVAWKPHIFEPAPRPLPRLQEYPAFFRVGHGATFVELVTVDKWYVRPSDPQFGRRAPEPWLAHFAISLEPSLVFVPGVDGWFQRAVEPVRYLPRCRDYIQDGVTADLLPDLFAVPTPTAWWVQASEPSRMPPPRITAPPQLAFSLEPSLYFAPPALSWWSAASEPVRSITTRVPGQGGGIAQFPQSDMTAETITVDKWWKPASEPQRGRRWPEPWLDRSDKPLEPSLFFTSAVNPDRWWQPASEPIRLVPRALQAPWHVAPPEPSTYLIPLHIGWWEQASEPVQSVPAGSARLITAAIAPAEPSSYLSLAHIGWWRPAAEPVRTLPPRTPGMETQSAWDAEPSIFLTPFVASWWTQPSEPVRGKRWPEPWLTAYERPTEPVQLNKQLWVDWCRPPDRVDKVRGYYPEGGAVTSLEDSIAFLPARMGWWQPTQEPVRTQLPRVTANGTQYVGPLEPTIYVLPAGIGWWIPAAEPVRGQPPRVPGIGTDYTGPLEPTLYVKPAHIGWWIQASEPVRTQLPRVTPGPYWFATFEPVQDLTIGFLSQWYQQATEPVRGQPPRVPGLGFVAFVGNPTDFPVQLSLGDVWIITSFE